MMYRAVTWAALQHGLSTDNGDALGALAHQTTAQEAPGGTHTQMRFLVGEKDVTGFLRKPEVDRLVSLVSQHAAVRQALVEQQRQIAQRYNIIAVGRDIGTVVLPNADLKVFLTASPEERAHRRHEEMKQGGSQIRYEAVLEETKQRDKLDTERIISPLKPAPDAVLINTDGISVAQVVDRIRMEFRRKTGHA